MKLYNIMIYYKGEGSTNIYIPELGDTVITEGRPIYLKNASFNVLEAIRSFRNMGIDIKLNVGSLGAFRTVDLGESRNPVNVIKESRPTEKVDAYDIQNVLKSGSKGPIILDEEPIKESLNNIDYDSYVLPGGKFEGKTLLEVDKMGKLKSVYNGFKNRNPEVKEAIEKYYENHISE